MDDEFVDLLMTIEGGEPSQELFSLLFDLLIENSAVSSPAVPPFMNPFSISSSSSSPINPSSSSSSSTSSATTTASGSASAPSPSPLSHRQLDFFHIFFEVLRLGRCDSSIQGILLRKLNAVVSTSTRVQAHCSDKNTWLFRLLRMLPHAHDPIVRAEVLQLISTLGCFSLSVLDLKSIFALLRASPADGDATWHELLDVLHCLRRRSGPLAFYDMDGIHSGIQLPPVDYFPNRTYTFCAWLRVESFTDLSPSAPHPSAPHPSAASAYRPHLLQFASSAGEGSLGVFFHDQRLHIETNGSPPTGTKFRFEPRRWYFVAITHSYYLLAKDELRLYVDGILSDELKSAYPKTSKPFVRCVIGNNDHQDATNQLQRPQPFFGQLGRLLFFSEVLSPDAIKQIHAQGPDSPTLYSDQGEPLGGQHGTYFFCSKKKSFKLFLAFDPHFFSGSHVIETSNLDGAVSDRNATKMLGTREVLTNALKDALSCAGGVQTILPLFAQLTTPSRLSASLVLSSSSSPSSSSTTPTPSSSSTSTSTSSSSVVVQEHSKSIGGRPTDVGQELRALFELTGHLLLRTPVNQLSMIRFDAFAIVGSFFRKSDPSAWTPALITILETFANGIRINETLFRQFYRNILLDFGIWSRGDQQVQETLIEVLHRHVDRDANYFRRLITVQRLVDALWSYYWFKEAPKSQQRSNYTVTAQTIPLAVVRLMRVKFLQLIKVMTNNQLDYAETRAIVMYLHNCSDPDQLIDVLQMLLSIFEASPRRSAAAAAGSKEAAESPEIVQHILKLGGLNLFLGLLENENQVVRVWAIKCIGKLLELSSGKIRSDLLADDSLVGMKRLLQHYPFTEPIYTSIFEVLLERVNPIHIRDPTDVHSDMKPSLHFRHPAMLAAIFELNCVAGQLQLQHRALKAFYELLLVSHENRTIFLKQNNWPNWLLGILAQSGAAQPATPQPGDSSSQNQDLSEASDNYFIVVRLFALLLHHSITAPKGWHLFYQAHAMIAHLDQRGNLGAFDLIRKIHASLLSLLTANNCKGFLDHVNTAGGIQSPGWTNIVRWVAYLDQQLFCGGPLPQLNKRGSQSGVPPTDVVPQSEHPLHRDAEGQWIDFQFAQRMLDFLDHLLIMQPTLMQQYQAQQAQLQQQNPKGVRGSLPSSGSQGGVMMTPNSSATTIPSSPSSSSSSLSSSFSSLPLGASASTDSVLLGNLAPSILEEDTLARNALRLTLFTLCETDSFLNTEKTQEKKENLKSVEKILEESCERIAGGRIRQTLSGYLRGKIRQWNEQISQIQSIFTRNISRLSTIVKGVIDRSVLQTVTEVSLWRVYHVIYFLYTAMKRSYETKGVGAQMILVLFKRILLLGRHLMPLPLALKDATEDLLTEFVMKVIQRSHDPNQPDIPDSAPLMRCLDHALNKAQEEDRVALSSSKELLRLLKESTRNNMQRTDDREAHAQVLFQERFTNMMQHFRAEEIDRRAGLQSFNERRQLSLDKKWKQILRDISHPRGAWPLHPHQVEHVNDLTLHSGEDAADVGSERLSHWRLSKSELPARMRILLKRNYKFSNHKNCIRDFEAPRQFSVMPTAQPADGQNGAQPARFTEQLINNEEIVFQAPGHLILPMQSVRGHFALTNQSLHFILDTGNTKQWQVNLLKGIYRRRFLLCDVALELFFIDDRICFVAFDSVNTRNTAYNKLVQLDLPCLESSANESSSFLSTLRSLLAPPSPANLLQRSGLTEKWRKRKITNFEYLMHLNTYAGRTYADLTQYPVFPWILTDYVSEQINLSDASIYRDLSKPIGALNPATLDQILLRYESFDDPEIPKFHYGTHYSNVGLVTHFLLRMEPFTTHAINLQGGYFDHERRMFHSVADAWTGVWSNPADVKELIPEFFYQPEFLRNTNYFSFGKERLLHDVVLPPWANNDPWEFVSIMRDALESEIVSASLHLWIDLIFGHKQRGKDAEKACNVFYYTTYEGAVQMDTIADDPLKLNAVREQIINFGQTPSQLFTKPHPRRHTLGEFNSQRKNPSIPLSFPPVGTEASFFSDPVCFLSVVNSKVTSCSAAGQTAVVNFTPPFTLDLVSPTKKPQNCPLQFYQSCIAVTRSMSHRSEGSTDSPLLFVCNPWEHTFSAKSLTSSPNTGYKWVKAAVHHKGMITCLALARDDKTIVTGSDDCTVMLWKINCKQIENASVSGVSSNGKDSLFRPVTMLYGHDRAVLSVTVSSELGVCVSGSLDGTCIVHDIRKNRYIRTIRRAQSSSPSVIANQSSSSATPSTSFEAAAVTLVSISQNGLIASYSAQGGLQIHSVNGQHLASYSPPGRTITAFTFAFSGRYLIAGGDLGLVQVFAAHSLTLLYSYQTSIPEGLDGVRCLTLSDPDEEYLFVGYSNGKISNYPFNPLLFDQRWRERNTPAIPRSESGSPSSSTTQPNDDEFEIL